ncbi:DNA (cytosine-5-)-methyltransferase [Enterococcus plantarum]|uniref:DNA cytosine methyltransferase n=1 Tax=Enterococcus plantarum TaxID=1077675 RepID=UPI001A90C9D6|nr:DNA cytosine methyltransferase [Enterococcus plantarum]MBO0465936.1 DNA (cytosine-5-)-methyltransferase [Enterococcus plantarum]
MTLKFIDLFAGIGGFRIGMERAGYECVFSSEIDLHACEMYEENFGDNPYCDITKYDVSKIPDFDVLCAGFPCQSFSISGKQKGFYDDIRGTLFFDICRVLEAKKPRAFILENVKNLSTHDKGRTLSVMLDALSKLGYTVNFKILNAKDFGVPQNRERVIIVGNREGKFFDFERLVKSPVESMEKFLDKTGLFEILEPDEYTLLNKEYIKRQPQSGLEFIGYRNKKMRTVGVREGTEHLSRVHKQPNRIYSSKGVHPTLPSQETAGRFYIYVDGIVRKLTIKECYRFMGFPENFIKVGKKGQLYSRIGNSICVNVVYAVAKELEYILEGEFELITEKSPREELENLFLEAQGDDIFTVYSLKEEQLSWVNTIVEKEANNKAVYTVLLTSLFYKYLHPEQDVRIHQVELSGGYSGRTFDTKIVTPFLKDKRFRGAMKESGWLTRSLEQKHPYTLDFPGAINNKEVKISFLNILNDIEENNTNPKLYIMNILKRSIIEKEKENIIVINPVTRESNFDIHDIMNLLENHFNHKYSSRGASILPVVAFYSIYECLLEEMSRYSSKKIDELASHYSSDRSSGATGDIVVRNQDNTLYEVVEIKFGIEIDKMMLEDAYNKIKPSTVQRYYILSTKEPTDKERKEFDFRIEEIKKEHGVQIIINGLMKTLAYYLRLLEDTDKFIEKYILNMKENSEINYEHQVSWNNLIKFQEKN